MGPSASPDFATTVGQVLELTLIRQAKQITRDVAAASWPTIAP